MRIVEMIKLIKDFLGGLGCMLVVLTVVFLFSYVGKYGCTAFKSSESRADHLFHESSREYINALRSSDPVKRAKYAGYVAKDRHNAILFVPYLIELLGDNTQLQVVKGPPVATKSLGNVVGDTTPSDRALYALKEITGKDFGKNARRWKEWWDGWWTENRHRFKENPNR